ncbi:glycoside hydrolase family 76 protein [Terriglobus sp. ADX1]|uniref:glycoside hydrolase family 76 protein n=1 Tax=Terriglobus sp. ADX1 TaxID=2794063 RepID=UPI002FE575F4
MIQIKKMLSGGLATISVVLAGLTMAPTAYAQNAQAAFNAYNSAYLVQSDGKAYYADTLTTQATNPDWEWAQAVDIYVAEDAYEYTRNATDRALVIALLDNLESKWSDWQTDGWDDNLAWMAVAFMRGYKLTGHADYLTQAEAGFNTAWSKGWTTNLGGGILEKQDGTTKCALSNNPFIIEGVDLYQATGDSSYLTKAEQIYDWVRTHLYVLSTGQENGCENGDGSLQVSNEVYNSGTFVEAANALYRITGNQTYYNEAYNATNHIVNADPIISSTNNSKNNEWQYWFTRGLSHFATDNNLWPTYQTWLQNNANAAWNERNNLNLTWNTWTQKTPSTSYDANVTASAAAIGFHLPPPALDLSGTWEIDSAKTGLAVTILDGSDATKAAVVEEPSTGGPHQYWTFKATSGGYYQIINNASGLAMNVTGSNAQNAKSGALIIQYTPQVVNPGNDQWLPIKNSDGTYSFYSLNSLQALEVPGGSPGVGTQLDQWFGNGSSNQSFKLIAH